MKRRIVIADRASTSRGARTFALVAFTVGALSAIAGCSRPETIEAPAPPTIAGWVTPPMIRTVERSPANLVVRGMTAPQGRVVVRGEGETAYATSADPQGRFELRMQQPTHDALYVVETRNGQDGAPAPYRLFVSRDPAGPVALLSAGTPSVRLDSAGELDVVDSDGATTLASGRAKAGTTVAVADGGRPLQAIAGPDGRWTAMLDLTGSGGAQITAGRANYAYPGALVASTPGLAVVRSGAGWTVSWSITPGAGQSSWFPAR